MADLGHVAGSDFGVSDNNLRRSPLLNKKFNFPEDRCRVLGFLSQLSPRQHGHNLFRVSYLATPAGAQWFLSLPPKIQRTQFSREEQLLLGQSCRQSSFLDLTDDRSLHSVDTDTTEQSFLSSPFAENESLSATTTVADDLDAPSSTFLDTSDDDSDIYSQDMNDSLLESFRRLDGDGKLDLSLGNYRTQNAPSRTPSYARSRRSSTTEGGLKPRPSFNYQPGNRFRSLSSSVEPTAQYVLDPDARLKLRLYLSSPQKFDEAVEFGFPALESKNANRDPPSTKSKKANKAVKPNKYVLTTGTFYEDDDKSTFCGTDERNEHITTPSQTVRKHYRGRKSSNLTASDIPPRPCILTAKPGTQRNLGNREMTLRMTLTRPDLRTESFPMTPSTNDSSDLDKLSPYETSLRPWELEDDDDEQGGMKKLWSRLRRRVCRPVTG